MKYPKHLFLTYGSYESYWWTREDGLSHYSNCTPRDRAEVLQFSFAALQSPPLNDKNKANVFELTLTFLGIFVCVYSKFFIFRFRKHSKDAVMRDPMWYLKIVRSTFIAVMPLWHWLLL